MVENPPAKQETQETPGQSLGGNDLPWRREWQTTTVFLPGKSHGQRSLVGSMVLGSHKESDTTQRRNISSSNVDN